MNKHKRLRGGLPWFPPVSFLLGWEGGTSGSTVKMCSDSENKTKMDGNMLNETKSKRRKFVQIITCCEEAKLTVLGTSYAIWVDTPPMSRIPAVLLRRMASLLSLPGMLTSTTASSSGKSEKHPWEQNKTRELGSFEESSYFHGTFQAFLGLFFPIKIKRIVWNSSSSPYYTLSCATKLCSFLFRPLD